MKNIVGDSNFVTDFEDFNTGGVINGCHRSVPMLGCSGLTIASKHKNVLLSTFERFEDHGSFWGFDCPSNKSQNRYPDAILP
jgi:hypothetical protein